MNIKFYIVFGLTRPEIEAESTVSVADALFTRPLIGSSAEGTLRLEVKLLPAYHSNWKASLWLFQSCTSSRKAVKTSFKVIDFNILIIETESTLSLNWIALT